MFHKTEKETIEMFMPLIGLFWRASRRHGNCRC